MFARKRQRIPAAAAGAAGAAPEPAAPPKPARRRRRRWPWLAACGGLLVAGGAATYWLVWGTPEAGANDVITQTATASLQTLDQSVSASGTITQAVNESVAFEASGTVLSVAVAAGDMVEAGQTLATIDTLQLDAARLEAKANLAQAESSLASAEAAADGSTASDAKIAAAEAQVAVAAANLATAEANMADAVLVAPAAGQITSVGVAVGDVVGSTSGAGGAGATSGSGAAMGGAGQTSASAASSSAAFTIVGAEDWSIDLTVSDSDLALLEIGGQAEITVDGVSQTVFGVISSLGRVASTSGGSAAFPVVVEITGQPEGLFDGLSATVALIYERRVDVLTVPLNAVQTIDGATYVDKMVDGVATRTEVGIGQTAGSLVEITSGLAEGDEVQFTVALSTGSSDPTGGGQGESGFQMGPGAGGDMPFGDMPGGGV
ncbi:MAG: efflux RND transporter periplasmic adaptor subunit, partial [Bifidobacteriaceae bacterium]|nr:efflux RND transporter periplasmic adaptor subunit [Bifidobacteriaceae bacterium]